MWIDYKMTFFFWGTACQGDQIKNKGNTVVAMYKYGLSSILLLLPRPDDLSDSPAVAWLKKKGWPFFFRPVGDRNTSTVLRFQKTDGILEHGGWFVAMFGLMFDWFHIWPMAERRPKTPPKKKWWEPYHRQGMLQSFRYRGLPTMVPDILVCLKLFRYNRQRNDFVSISHWCTWYIGHLVTGKSRDVRLSQITWPSCSPDLLLLAPFPPSSPEIPRWRVKSLNYVISMKTDLLWKLLHRIGCSIQTAKLTYWV